MVAGARSGGRASPSVTPSPYAADRFRGELRRELADLRLRLQETTLRSDALLRAGHPDAAAEVVAEQRQLLARFHAQVARVAAGAAVEAEAERVLAGAPALALATADSAPHRPRPPASRPPPAPRPLPVAGGMVSALVALALAALALLAAAPYATEPTSVAALGDPVTADGPVPDAAPSSGTAAGSEGAPAPSGDPGVLGRGSATPPAAAPSAAVDPTAGPAGGPSEAPGLVDALLEVADDAVRDAVRTLLSSPPAPVDGTAGPAEGAEVPTAPGVPAAHGTPSAGNDAGAPVDPDAGDAGTGPARPIGAPDRYRTADPLG